MMSFFDWLSTLALQGFGRLWWFLNSSLGIATIATALAAYFGSRGAERSAAKEARRRRFLDEIAYTNACISITFIIVNTLLGLKGQHVARMKTSYDELRRAFLDRKRRVEAGEVFSEPFAVPADFETLETPVLPVGRLEDLAFEKLLLPGRALIVVPTVIGAMSSLRVSIQERNALIAEYRQGGTQQTDRLLRFYFGLRDRAGNIDNRYGASVENIYKQTDDCLFFTRFLKDDLVAHGEVQRARYYKVFGRFAPKIHKPEFSTPEALALMPSPAPYASWTAMFVLRPQRFRLSVRTRVRRRLWDRPRTGTRRLCGRIFRRRSASSSRARPAA